MPLVKPRALAKLNDIIQKSVLCHPLISIYLSKSLDTNLYYSCSLIDYSVLPWLITVKSKDSRDISVKIFSQRQSFPGAPGFNRYSLSACIQSARYLAPSCMRHLRNELPDRPCTLVRPIFNELFKAYDRLNGKQRHWSQDQIQ